MKVLIIEDEQPAARRLSRLISEAEPEAVIIGVIDTVKDAVQSFEEGINPDLIFMDIQLADGISFDIFQKTKVNTAVIFTTAYDHYAINAFKVNSIDYLLKPVEPVELKNAIDKWKTLFRHQQSGTIDYSLLAKAISQQKEPFKKRFLVRTGSKLSFINIEDVAYFFSDGGSTFLVTNSADRFLLDGTLDDIEHSLEPAFFFRINRKIITSLKAIRRIEPHFNNRFILEIQPAFEEELVVSRQRSTAFREWLDK